jgi:hypothetical protein
MKEGTFVDDKAFLFQGLDFKKLQPLFNAPPSHFRYLNPIGIQLPKVDMVTIALTFKQTLLCKTKNQYLNKN